MDAILKRVVQRHADILALRGENKIVERFKKTDVVFWWTVFPSGTVVMVDTMSRIVGWHG